MRGTRLLNSEGAANRCDTGVRGATLLPASPSHLKKNEAQSRVVPKKIKMSTTTNWSESSTVSVETTVETTTSEPISDSCTETLNNEDYVLWQNVMSVFIVLVISAAGTMTAILLGSRSRRRQNNRPLLVIIRIMKYFGVGVILCTAWVHILPDAFGTFSDPCLQDQPGWGEYGAFPGVFGIVATFVIQAIEFLILDRTKAYSTASVEHLPNINEIEQRMASESADTEQQLSEQSLPQEASGADANTETAGGGATVNRTDTAFTNLALSKSETMEHIVDVHAHGHSSQHSHAHSRARSHSDQEDVRAVGHQHCSVAHPVGGQSKAKDIGTLSLELGIVVHSVVIGLTLGVSSGQEWLSLLIAICFHQLFEGIALGTLISELNHVRELPKRIGLGLAYPITTPIGIAIGIGIHLVYESNAVSLLLVKGILNSLAGGILMYNSYIELLGLEMNHSKVFHSLSSTMKGCSFLAVYVGAAAMAVLAIWA